MRRISIVTAALAWLAILCSARVQAAELRVRAILANPGGDEETEWVALENLSSATVSASLYSLQDAHGSTREYFLSDLVPPGDVLILPRTLTGITLNNDREQILLRRNGELIQTTAELVSPASDQVWAELGGTWQYISLQDWERRRAERDWSVPDALPQPSPTPPTAQDLVSAEIHLTLVSPCSSPEWVEVEAATAGIVQELSVEDSSGLIIALEDLELSAGERRRIQWAGAKLSNSGEWLRVLFPESEQLFAYEACTGSLPYRFSDGKWQQIALSEQTVAGGTGAATPAGEVVAPPPSPSTTPVLPELPFSPQYVLQQGGHYPVPAPRPFPSPPLPDFLAEETRFMDWKRDAVLGGLSLVFSGTSGLLLSVPHLFRWYNEHRDPW